MNKVKFVDNRERVLSNLEHEIEESNRRIVEIRKNLADSEKKLQLLYERHERILNGGW